MSVPYMFCVASNALSVGEISHAPVPASPPRDRVLFLFSSLRGFLFRHCPHCLSELRRAITCSIISPPRMFFRTFVLSKGSVPSSWVGYFSYIPSCISTKTFQPINDTLLDLP